MSSKSTESRAEYEAEVILGLEAIATDELRRVFPDLTSEIRQSRAGFLRFRFAGDAAELKTIRTVIALYRIHSFAIPRPRAFLGHEHFTRLLRILRGAARGLGSPPKTMGIAAAGSHTAVMRRLRQETCQALGLRYAEDDKGELFLRLARQTNGSGWEALVRTTASPLSKRDYRVIDVPGALNATVAYAMTRLGRSRKRQVVLNLCSGSSTILIEHALTDPEDLLLAIDNRREMLEIGRQNAQSARKDHRIRHLLADARQAPLPAASLDLLYADLPFGHHMGSHEDNLKLYPDLLREANRLAKPRATFVVLTHDIRLMNRAIRESNWRLRSETKINLRGLHPRLFVLERNSARI